MKYIYISDGGKGGVGKSFCSSAVCEALLEKYGNVALVEGDDSQPDLALRYQSDPNVLLGVLPLNESGDANRAVSKFAGWLETNQPDRVVINLPAGAAKTLAAHADLIRMSADEFGYKIVGLYALAHL